MADESLNLENPIDFSKLKVPDLKKELKNKGLSTTGNKNELIERLQAALKIKKNTDSIDDIEEDLLNDVDDEHLDERDSIIHDLENDLDDLPKPQKRKLPEETDKAETTVGPPKKVILKRNNSDTLQLKSQALINGDGKSNPVTKPQTETSTPNEKEEKKVIKLSELSAKERLEMRVKKFGVTTLNDSAKKLARAERFNAGTPIKGTSTINTNIDVLKQRAARFGTSVSSVMSDLEKQEKIEKRKERFGIVTKTNVKVATDLEAAKAARLKRFQTTVT